MTDATHGAAFLLINGECVGAEQSETVTAPASGQVVGSRPIASAADTRRAITAAASAAGSWARTPPRERGRMLRRIADDLEGRKSTVACVLAQESGKLIVEAEAEVNLAVEFFRWFAEEGRRAYGEMIASPDSQKRLAVFSRPRGVAGLLTPWNFPVSILARKVAAALAAGCTVVARPSSTAPLAALGLADSFLAAGLPAGVVNIVAGDHDSTADVMVNDPRIRTISFTGSTTVGRGLARRAVGRLAHVALELGGDAPFLVFDDADIDVAVEQAVTAKFRNNGQSCIAMNRLYVQAGVADRFFAALGGRISNLRLGDPLAPETTLGPVMSEERAERLRGLVNDANAEANDRILGEPIDGLRRSFVQPTIVINPRRRSRLAREEVFGPVVGAWVFRDEASGLAAAAHSPYGLAAYVMTRDVGRMDRAAQLLHVGILGVNDAAVTTPEAPFGGVRLSGWGKEGGHLGLDEYIDRTLVSTRLPVPK